MKRRWFIFACAILLAAAGTLLGLVAALRLRDARAFRAPRTVRVDGGISYTVALREVMVGPAGADYALLVFLRLSNPGDRPLHLERSRFEVQTGGGRRFAPMQTTAAAELTLAARAAADELLSYRLPAEAMDGPLWLALQDGALLTLKSSRRWQRQLREGEFVSYRRRHW